MVAILSSIQFLDKINLGLDTNFAYLAQYFIKYGLVAKFDGHLVSRLVGHLGFLHFYFKEIIYNVTFGFLDPKNLYLDTNFMSLSQLLTMLYGGAISGSHLVGHLGFLHCCLKEIIYNVIFGFRDPENPYLDTNFMSLSQLLTKL